MDELQGRLNTPGALVKKGTSDEPSALPALPLPTTQAVRPTKLLATDRKWVRRQRPNLLAGLRKTVSGDDCDLLHLPPGSDFVRGDGPDVLRMWRLNAKQLLVSEGCNASAYNFTSQGFWVIAESPPFEPILVATGGLDFHRGIIEGKFKSRGLGDCWSGQSWVWNGHRFIHAEAYSTGQCKGFLVGAWPLHTVTSHVIRP